MSEYECALFDAILILGDAIVKLGASESQILSKFKEASNSAKKRGRENEEATLDLLIRFLFEEPRYYVAVDPNKK
jgi:hypothetical protein